MQGENRRKWPSEFIKKGADKIGIACPKCGCKDLRVTNSLPSANGSRRRRRVCRNCGRVFYTNESI
jgi:predicted  nucleic acid-binding Zn-ribbon protein